MRIFTWNVAAWAPTVRNIELRHGSVASFFNEELGADIVCLQEAKVNHDRLDRAAACVPGFESFWSISQSRKGYSGVTTFVSLRYAATRAEVDCLPGATDDLNKEGRVVLTEHPGGLAVINVYVPNAGGVADPTHERVDRKCRFLEGVQQLADRLRAAGKEVVIAGDLNSALEPRDCHECHDFARMYTQRELSLFWALVDTYKDAWRRLHPDESGVYTVFDERTSARSFNQGSRIDYTLVSPGLLDKIVSCDVVSTPPKWSDHVGVELVLKDVPSHPPGAEPPPCALSSRKLFSSPLAALFAKAQAGGGGSGRGCRSGGGRGSGGGSSGGGIGEKAAMATASGQRAAAGAAGAGLEGGAGGASGGGGGSGVVSVDGGSGPGPPSKRAAEAVTAGGAGAGEEGGEEEGERAGGQRKRARVAADSPGGGGEGGASEGERGGEGGGAAEPAVASPMQVPAPEHAGAGSGAGGGSGSGSKARNQAGKTQQKKKQQQQQQNPPPPLSGGQRSITSFFGKRG